jgi:membrane-bound lytic murein transglycosylase MltF
VVNLLWLFSVPAHALPENATIYRQLLVRAAYADWGTTRYLSALGAQVEQESGWRQDARSPYAEGPAQFTRPTASWFARTIGADLGPPALYDWGWSLPAMSRYMRHLYRRSAGATDCDRYWLALRGYNGGEGWITKESKNADDPGNHFSVDAACGTAGRAKSHCRENLGYPRRILLTIQPRYLAAGYGQGGVCL